MICMLCMYKLNSRKQSLLCEAVNEKRKLLNILISRHPTDEPNKNENEIIKHFYRHSTFGWWFFAVRPCVQFFYIRLHPRCQQFYFYFTFSSMYADVWLSTAEYPVAQLATEFILEIENSSRHHWNKWQPSSSSKPCCYKSKTKLLN